MRESTFQKVTAFPVEAHIRDVCKHGSGEAACRYLVIIGGKQKCGKFGPARDLIDRRVAEDSMAAKGNNCDGIAGILQSNAVSLAGTRVIYTERAPTLRVSGSLQVIDVGVSAIVMKVKWDDGQLYDPNFDLGTVQIDVTAEGLEFSQRGFGDLAGVVTLQL